MSALLPLLLACSSGQPPADPPLSWGAGSPVSLGDADAVAAADLDGDGTDEVILIADGVARWGDQEADLGGRIQAVGRGDVDGDGVEEALVATGVGRGQREVPARLWAIRADGARTLWEQDGPRAQVVDLHVLPGDTQASGGRDRVFLVHFEDRETAAGAFLQPDGTLDVRARARLSLAMVPLADGQVVVTRLYGDEPRSPGDAVRVAADGQRTPLATHRGVRAALAADLDGDGAEELLLADGWHHAYGREADPELRLFPGTAPDDGRVIARLDGSYAVTELAVVPDAPGGPAILATGSHGVFLLQRDALGWAATPVAPVSETGNAVLLREGNERSVLVSGQPARRVPLQAR